MQTISYPLASRARYFLAWDLAHLLDEYIANLGSSLFQPFPQFSPQAIFSIWFTAIINLQKCKNQETVLIGIKSRMIWSWNFQEYLGWYKAMIHSNQSKVRMIDKNVGKTHENSANILEPKSVNRTLNSTLSHTLWAIPIWYRLYHTVWFILHFESESQNEWTIWLP